MTLVMDKKRESNYFILTILLTNIKHSQLIVINLEERGHNYIFKRIALKIFKIISNKVIDG